MRLDREIGPLSRSVKWGMISMEGHDETEGVITLKTVIKMLPVFFQQNPPNRS